MTALIAAAVTGALAAVPVGVRVRWWVSKPTTTTKEAQ